MRVHIPVYPAVQFPLNEAGCEGDETCLYAGSQVGGGVKSGIKPLLINFGKLINRLIGLSPIRKV